MSLKEITDISKCFICLCRRFVIVKFKLGISTGSGHDSGLNFGIKLRIVMDTRVFKKARKSLWSVGKKINLYNIIIITSFFTNNF